jgi:hypothetical protein
VAALLILGAAAFVVGNRLRYGGWLWAGRYGFRSEMQPFPLWQSAWAFLLSPNKSFFLYSPPALVALWFWGGFWRRFPAMRPVVVGAALLTLFHLTARTWAEETWGARRMHYLVPLAILPLGVWWERRAELGRWTRRAAWAVLAFGVWVQLVGVAFDYTSLAFTLGFNPLFSQEHYLWDPQFNHLRFNLHLAESDWSRHRGGPSLPYAYEQHYMGWTYAGPYPAPRLFGVAGRDRLDWWPLQQRDAWPGRPYWLHAATSWLALALAAGALGALAWLIVALRRGVSDTRANPGPR